MKTSLRRYAQMLRGALSAPGEAAGSRAALSDLVLPLVGMYSGQFLSRSIPRAQWLGLLVIGISLGVLLLRVHRSAVARAFANWLQVAAGLVLTSSLAFNPGEWRQWTPTWQLFAVWLLACILVIAGVLKLRPRPIRLGLQMTQPLDRRDWLIMVLLLAGSLLLRVPSIETVPLGVDPDEGSFAQLTYDAAVGASKDPFGVGWVTHPTLQFFVNSVFVRIFGRTFLAMRLPWAIAGSLIAVAVYLLARAAYGRRVGALAGALVMGSNVAIHFSRLGINNISDGLFMVWTLAALWLAGASGSSKAYAGAGAVLGFSQYYYFGSRAIPFVVVATLLVWLVADPRGTLRAWPLILGSFLVALVVAGPLFGNWVLRPGSLTEHLDLTLPFSTHLQREAAGAGMGQWSALLLRIRDSLLVFTLTPDRGSFYHPGQPMLHPFQGPLFVIGLVALAVRWRRPFTWGLIAWVLVDLTLGSVLITDAATFHRLLGLLPAGLLIVALGVDAGARVLAGQVRGSELAATLMAVLVAAGLVGADVYYYFRDYNVHQAYKTPDQEAITLAALDYEWQHGRGTFVLYTNEGVDASGRIYHTPISYVSLDTFVAGSPQVEDRLNTVQPLYFYVLPDKAAELPRIRDRFPGGAIKEYRRSADNLLVMTRYAVVPLER